MHSPTRCLWVGLIVCTVVAGCSYDEHQYHAKKTHPVTGTVTVNGSPPGSPIVIQCHPENGIDASNPSVTQGLTLPDGSFHLSTYEDGDGVPPGNYALTFYWGEFKVIQGSYGGPDKLKNRYAKSDKSPIRLAVDGSGPVEMGTIDLTTK
ncbi:hypothetical protein [Bremerella cremea]|uniref:hypothetical protein n=1 Tax=Bremerella cremea TaxID=1031537 RepID=UPI0031F01B6D